MRHYIVSYNITVDVCVDLDTGTIDKVVLNDEDMGGPYAYFEADDHYEIGDQIDTTDVDNMFLVQKLFDLVEGTENESPEWPTWEHGW